MYVLAIHTRGRVMIICARIVCGVYVVDANAPLNNARTARYAFIWIQVNVRNIISCVAGRRSHIYV